MTLKLDLIIAVPSWRKIAGLRVAIRKAARETARDAGLSEVTLLLTDDEAVQALNHQFRGKAKPTNVLSFARAPGAGDVALAFETVAAEARAQGKTMLAHLTHLVVHGLLHLAGHDHMKKADARRMEALEIAILLRLGLLNPYLLKPERRMPLKRLRKQRT